jgi:hypothetical protein
MQTCADCLRLRLHQGPRPSGLLPSWARTPDLGPDLVHVQVTEDGSSSRDLPFFLLLNEVTEEGSSFSILPFVCLLAWFSRQGRKVGQTQVAY